ncbi:uncharacterized protein LOC120336907 [Styela clava]
MSFVATKIPKHPATNHKCSFIIIGIFEVLAGLICSIVGILLVAQIGSSGTSTNAKSGIGTGVLYVISGILALSAGQSPTQCNIIGGMILASISAFISSAIVVLGIWILQIWGTYENRLGSRIHGIMATIIVACAIEFVFALAHLVYCCRARCCTRSSSQVRQISQKRCHSPIYDDHLDCKVLSENLMQEAQLNYK